MHVRHMLRHMSIHMSMHMSMGKSMCKSMGHASTWVGMHVDLYVEPRVYTGMAGTVWSSRKSTKHRPGIRATVAYRRFVQTCS